MSSTPHRDGPGSGALAVAPSAPATELTGTEQQRMVRALMSGLARCGETPRLVETHISLVLLHGGRAFKIKKVLATSFLDQSTLARRQAACSEELRLNRRLAPQLYLGVVPITGTVDAPVLDGSGPPLDVAVKMRAFDEDGLWDRLAARGALCNSDIDELAALLARFHADAAVADPAGWPGTPAQVRPVLLDSLRDLEDGRCGTAWPAAADLATLRRLRDWEAERFPRLEAVMTQRLAAGRVREGHGDLHLGNVAREAGHCLVFDGIEFDAALRWIDVMNDVAFMAMDLQAHGLSPLAHRFVDAYLQQGGDHDGMRVFEYYLLHRALVRTKVAQLRAAQAQGRQQAQAVETARHYLDLAWRLCLPRQRALLITHGLSGSGKTTLTQGLLEAIGAPRIRADVERKRLAGLAPAQRSHSALAAGLYSAAMNEATQRRLLDGATAVLEGGWPVILDATFLRRADRDAARQRAADLGVPFFILQFSAPPETLRARVRQRAAGAGDASEADEAVLALQMQMQEPLQPDEQAAVHAVTVPEAPDASDAPGAPAQADWTLLRARLDAAPARARP